MNEPQPIPRVRAPRLRQGPVPRWWFFGNAYSTHSSNALQLLFPDGERFFIRSVLHYKALIDTDPILRARVRGFVGQEGRHGHAHERVQRILEEQGYRVDGIARRFKWAIERVVEPALPPLLRLSATAAIEHLTAALGLIGLDSNSLDGAPEPMVDLFKWHGAEEIEHRSVAFDVLMRVDDRYPVRIAGLAIAGVVLAPAWWLVREALLAQERERGVDLDEQRRIQLEHPGAREDLERWRNAIGGAIRDYLRRDFHPDEDPRPAELAREYLAQLD